MGMTIDEAIGIITAKGNYSYTVIENEAKDVLVDTARKYQMVRADYENRLKADMVAMLTEMQLEIEEIRTDEPIYNGHGICGWEGKWAEDIIQECSKIIQEKINSLKREE